MTSQQISPFAELGLPEPLLQALRDVGYETPSPIQAATIPPLLAGRDVLGQAQTGTGKTAAFALPILAKIDCNARHTQALVLAPTRELAIQVAEAFARYATHLPGFNVLPIYGGQSYVPQLASLKRGAHVVVGTPGRIIDHLERGTLKLDQLAHMVLDEADEMLRMGFIDDVESILKKTPPQRQVALFSATMPSAIRRIAQTYLRDPQEITIKAATTTATHIQQRYWMVSGLHKLDALTRILEVEPFEGMIIFARTKQATEELAEKLAARGFTAAALNGDVPQALRERMVQRLKDGQLDILVATDVAARGLDVERISHVVNYDIPTDTESYVHRIGRTGRAGRSGDAILFVTPRERHLLRAIERATRQPITQMQLPSTEAVNDSRISRFMERITEAREQEGLEDYQRLVERYEQEFDIPAIEIAAALARMVQGNKPLLMRPGSEPTYNADTREESRAPRREREPREGREPRAPRPARATREEAPAARAPRERAKPRDLDDFTQTLMQAREAADAAPHSAPREVASAEHPAHSERTARGPHTASDVRFETYRVEVGRDHGVEVRNLVGAIANEAGLENKHIGNIAIRGDHSFVELPEGMPKDVFRTLQKTWVSGRQLQLTKAEPVRDTARERPATRAPARRFDSGDASPAPKRRAAPMPGGKSFKRKP
ncbi:MAG: ATP-dependent RNA helicase [Thiomonas sp. 20-64-9]|jgi:ATP-dependent RNA helicase DeaD|uniref:DEAD/DEAH box helicase n=1 Tax=unclassified Thiomonas TaxID=2625466 RepID=UPI000BCCC4C2|nr:MULTISPECIES: DEAD/DEAH box helicase [unclassified Thiomonas]OYV30777.1 MAG: ATP-dependent RNA helicase [Thiomonas sp. 20-64-9]OZB70240.1 MAG: ATP-dependent RNA helicase [Thiomonas sp. 13-64-67]